MMNHSVHAQNGVATVVLEGSMYVQQAHDVRNELLERIDKGEHHLVIDMTRLDYIDSSGLGALIAIHKRAQQFGGTMKVKGLNGAVKTVFEMTRLNRMFEVIEESD